VTDPFKIDSPTCISFSGGRTSAYMLWRVLQSNGGLPADAAVCFANTGKEDEATLRFVRDCGRQWSVPITWVEYRNDERGFAVVDFDTASRGGEPFEALVTKKNYLPNPVARFCTSDLKVTPISRVAPDHDTMIGVRADEPRRVGKLRERGLLVPLVDAGVTQSDVQAFWRNQPFDLGLEFRNGMTSLGNCDLCFLKGAHQIQSLIADKPERAIWWAQREERIVARFRSDRPSYAQMAQFVAQQRDMFDPNEEAIACFCGD
jgi:3'-phosphoadenosine 5'-phosphosulfate sulfotransferase (PAPS reductase)/FAD synthetase